MQIDKLVLDLHPRTNMQALDLGFSLLRIAATQTWLAWLALWLPLMLVLTLIACIWPEYSGWLYFVAWWLRPLLERAPLYILSRAVFGENLRWQDAVRAWPKQLGGGWARLLLLRPFMAGRCLQQPVWLLEGARGKAASQRFAVIGRQNAGAAANWFGIACAHFEGILQFGSIALIGLFISKAELVNPFSLFFSLSQDSHHLGLILISYALFALSGAIIAPIYVACGFTLYLNRRAMLEAWDIELVLRQIQAPAAKNPIAPAKLAARLRSLLPLLPPLLLCASLLPHPQAQAAEANAQQNCTPPNYLHDPKTTQSPDQDPAQAAIRAQVRQIFAKDDLQSYRCKQSWFLKEDNTSKDKKIPDALPPQAWLNVVAEIIKILLIAALIGLLGWFLYRFRTTFSRFLPRKPHTHATEISGLDIRPESLPANIMQAVRQLWQNGQQRAALALLYRATLSRLVSENGLRLTQGATEGDCLQQAQRAHQAQRLDTGRWQVTQQTTELWQLAAYAQRWPTTEQLLTTCQAWQATFIDAENP